MLNKLIIPCVIILLSACSQTPNNEKVSEAIKPIMPPDFKIISVNPVSEFPGVYEVSLTMNKQPAIVYINKKGTHVLSGSLLELATKKNITIEAQNKIKVQP